MPIDFNKKAEDFFSRQQTGLPVLPKIVDLLPDTIKPEIPKFYAQSLDRNETISAVPEKNIWDSFKSWVSEKIEPVTEMITGLTARERQVPEFRQDVRLPYAKELSIPRPVGEAPLLTAPSNIIFRFLETVPKVVVQQYQNIQEVRKEGKAEPIDLSWGDLDKRLGFETNEIESTSKRFLNIFHELQRANPPESTLDVLKNTAYAAFSTIVPDLFDVYIAGRTIELGAKLTLKATGYDPAYEKAVTNLGLQSNKPYSEKEFVSKFSESLRAASPAQKIEVWRDGAYIFQKTKGINEFKTLNSFFYRIQNSLTKLVGYDYQTMPMAPKIALPGYVKSDPIGMTIQKRVGSEIVSKATVAKSVEVFTKSLTKQELSKIAIENLTIRAVFEGIQKEAIKEVEPAKGLESLAKNEAKKYLLNKVKEGKLIFSTGRTPIPSLVSDKIGVGPRPRGVIELTVVGDKSIIAKPEMDVKSLLGKTETFEITPIEQAEGEVWMELDTAEAGKRIMISSGDQMELVKFEGIKSSFPKWIPEHLRKKDLVNQVMDYMEKGVEPTQGRVKELYDIVKQEISNRSGVPLEQLKKPTEITPKIKKELEKMARKLIKEATVPGIPTEKTIKKVTIGEPSEFIRKRETTLLKDRIRNYAKGIREGRINIRDDIEETIKQFEGILKEANIPSKDYKKFIPKMREISIATDPIKAFHREFPEIQERVINYVESEAKRNLRSQIDKELKYTKPLKKGDRRVEKYDYETSKHFIDIRNYNKLNQEQALIELSKFEVKPTPENPEPIMGELSKIKSRFLSLQTNGAKASVAIHERVLEDIQRMKEVGETAKNLQDFEKLIERQERVNEAINALESIKVGKDRKGNIQKLLDKAFEYSLEKPYDRTIANTKSLLNSLMGSDFAEKYSPILISNKKDSAIYFKGKEIDKQLAKEFGTTIGGLSKKTIELAKETFNVTTDTGRSLELTKLDIMDIYNATKNEIVKERFNNWLGEGQVNSALGTLTSQEIVAADIMYDGIQEYYDIFNQLYIERYGRDLGKVKNYWPSTSEYEPHVLDEIRLQGETPSAMKARAQSTKVIPRPTNAILKIQRHIHQGEHVRYISRVYEDLKRTFTDRNVKEMIIDNYGKGIYEDLMKHVERLSLNYTTEQLDLMSGVMNKLLDGWTVAKIAPPNLSVPFRQLGSMTNYAERMPSGLWTKNFFKGVVTPKATFNYMWKNNPWIEARFNKGYSEALSDALDGVNRLKMYKGKWTNALTIPTRSSDIIAIIYGGKPYFDYLVKEKGLKEAKDIFEEFSLDTQQAGTTPSLSLPQSNKNPGVRLFFRFKNTSNQYVRKIMDDIIRHRRGEISTKQFAKTIGHYLILQSVMYRLLGYLAKGAIIGTGVALGLREWESDDEKDNLGSDIMEQIATQPFQALPFLDGMSVWAYRELTKKEQYQALQTPLIDDVNSALRILQKEELTVRDYFKVLGTIAEPTLMFPAGTLERYQRQIMGDRKKTKSGLPGLPELPKLPKLPKLPELPKLPKLPSLKSSRGENVDEISQIISKIKEQV